MQYYYLKDGQQVGPVEVDQLRGVISKETYVWHEGMANWQKAVDLPELASLFESVPPTPEQSAPTAPPSSANGPHTESYSSPKGGFDGSLPPDNYLVWAILTTILCCWPLGIVSIIYSARVNGLHLRGEKQMALRCSRLAKNWAIASAVVGVVILIIIGIVWGFSGCMELGSCPFEVYDEVYDL